MKIRIPEPFKKDYKELPNEIKDAVEKQIRFLRENPKHPSLQIHKVKGTIGIWEAYVTMKYRMTFEIKGDLLILRRVGDHTKVLRNP